MTCEEIENRIIAIAGEHMQLLFEHMEIFNQPGSEGRRLEIQNRIEQLSQEKISLVGR